MDGSFDRYGEIRRLELRLQIHIVGDRHILQVRVVTASKIQNRRRGSQSIPANDHPQNLSLTKVGLIYVMLTSIYNNYYIRLIL